MKFSLGLAHGGVDGETHTNIEICLDSHVFYLSKRNHGGMQTEKAYSCEPVQFRPMRRI